MEQRIIGGKGGTPAARSGAARALPAVRHVRIDEASAGQRLDNFLVKHLKGVPKSHLHRVIRAGEVRVNKGRAAADTRLALGDDVRIPPVRTSASIDARWRGRRIGATAP